jgi:KDO2-lipid IV(A) lauroyltransferase
MSSSLAFDGHFWRRVAAVGAQVSPEWFLRYSPTFFGAAAAVVLPRQRQAVQRSLRMIRGERGALREAVEVGKTFGAYAGCLAEILSVGSKKGNGKPDVVLVGKKNFDRATAMKKGILVATIHSGGWELVGPWLADYRKCELVMVMESERDERAREIQDRARMAHGLSVVHINEDPLSSLPILRHLREGNAVAFQVDRVPDGMRSVTVKMLQSTFQMPLGPLRLAQVSGAPLVPILSARTGYRRYLVEAHAPVVVSRRADAGELERAAQKIADVVSEFLEEHPTQWFHFVE